MIHGFIQQFHHFLDVTHDQLKLLTGEQTPNLPHRQYYQISSPAIWQIAYIANCGYEYECVISDNTQSLAVANPSLKGAYNTVFKDPVDSTQIGKPIHESPTPIGGGFVR